MQWEKLLSLRREGDTHKRLRNEQDETRLGFEVDYDRIIFSPYFRSLQDKTQVIPLSKTDFVHTRLTHSLEVSVVGRSLGRLAGAQILEKHPQLAQIHGYRFNDFGAIVAAAALSHDIGNPPFGHSGEQAIGSFFDIGPGREFKDSLTAKEYADLLRFEGNAHGFRLLSANRQGIPGGLRLSYATLGAFTKYPKESLPHQKGGPIATKKFGVFQSEVSTFCEIAEELGLKSMDLKGGIGFCRHPLTYLVEAADDICYTIIDFEDGINLGLIPEEYALEYLIKLVKDRINTEKYRGIPHMPDRIGYLRAIAIGTLVQDAVRIFMEEEEAILKGEFNVALLDKSRYKAQIEDIINLSVDRIYQAPEVVEKEVAGYKILSDILDVSTKAMVGKLNGKVSSYDKLILSMLPIEKGQPEATSVYAALLQACSFVASLSDRGAVHIHNKITGKQLQDQNL
ncbi:dGTP triphosphohydrolase [Robiginitalea aurantiaca]|uniref:DNTP triphosphohydrolase n=1 Tax=Robiginitalea aurantiaca TaxID=3056915 RepID=A0ABT7WAX3_9FLAO|nr:dNTP triphosphohydrolase [Robiginitalea aurantiaca]MDM9630057.1 dNTP triphosphohydrolase [Robiginitalea aurantiaca]